MGKKAKPQDTPVFSFDAFMKPKPATKPIVKKVEIPIVKPAIQKTKQPSGNLMAETTLVAKPKPNTHAGQTTPNKPITHPMKVVKPAVGSIPISRNISIKKKTKPVGTPKTAVLFKTEVEHRLKDAPKPKKKQQREKEHVVDVSEYEESEIETEYVVEDTVFFCKNCKNHFQHPKVVDSSIGQGLENLDDLTRRMLYIAKICPICDGQHVIGTSNEDTSNDNCCDTCGCKKDGTYLVKKYTDEQICVNCNREIMSDAMKAEHARHEHIPFADPWAYGKLVDHYSNRDDPQHLIPT